MILNLNDELFIDIDKVSLVIPEDGIVAVEGFGLQLTNKEYAKIIAKAFKWQHQTHMYNKELKREGGK
jgi:hypothetical protein